MRYWKTLLAAVLVAVSCTKDPVDGPLPSFATSFDENYVANLFARRIMSQYYLWNQEMDEYIVDWPTGVDPKEKVNSLRYKLSDGTMVDRWTAFYDDIYSLSASISGESLTTYGYEYQLWYKDQTKKNIVPVVIYTYPGGPADKAGLRRGDVILRVNGKELTPDNYRSIVNEELTGSAQVELDVEAHSSPVRLTSEKMYEDPVLMYRSYDCGDKKVGYMVYTSFTAASCSSLVNACKAMKKEGVSELILDLRYNGGGLVATERLLACLLAPESAVSGKEVFTTELYNNYLSSAMDSKSYFSPIVDFSYGETQYSYNVLEANLGITKLYALISSGSASASEALLTGLFPYLDIEMIGEKSHGKFCSGILLPAAEWYADMKEEFSSDQMAAAEKHAGRTGIYVMIGRYGDKNGTTPCMPDGFVPDIAVKDNPLDGFQLGDPRESLLWVALAEAGYFGPAPVSAPKSIPRQTAREPFADPDAFYGLRILK
ncbi:MAG: S41 family peptidase [Bacteroidales bacterium]|nr:S41 family peptidase [Bacteroidales bacterium]